MPHHRVTKSLFFVATATLALFTVTACSAVEEITSQQHSSSFADVSAMKKDSDLEVRWMPSDATSIRLVETTREGAEDATVLLDSASDLDPAICAPVDRLSAPSLSVEGAPDVYTLASVYACGEWSVAPAADGWYGWTPNHPDEQDDSPSS